MPLPRKKLLGIALLAEGAAFLAALALAYWFQIDLDFTPTHLLYELSIASLATIPLLALFAVFVSPFGGTVPFVRGLRKTLLCDVRPLFANTRLLDLFIVATVAGIAEESLFRGVIQTQLGIVPASVLFGLVHFVTPAYALSATLMGFYIGALFAVSESLFVVIFLHGLYDLCALVGIRFFVTDQPPPRPTSKS